MVKKKCNFSAVLSTKTQPIHQPVLHLDVKEEVRDSHPCFLTSLEPGPLDPLCLHIALFPYWLCIFKLWPRRLSTALHKYKHCLLHFLTTNRLSISLHHGKLEISSRARPGQWDTKIPQCKQDSAVDVSVQDVFFPFPLLKHRAYSSFEINFI